MNYWSNVLMLPLAVFLLSASNVCSADNQIPPDKTVTVFDPPENFNPEDQPEKQAPTMQDMGGGIYRIGAIKIDKAGHRMTIPGEMLPYQGDKPIEYLATMKQGYKSYESVLMLDSSAFEFNLACILTGLDSAPSVAPQYHFDPQVVKGTEVSIRISWTQDHKKQEVDALELLKIEGEKPTLPSVWSYSGSMFMDDGRYLAEVDGVLIGMIHDPSSIIEHREGLGLGNWGAISIDPDIAPAGGQQVVLEIQRMELD